MFESRDPMDRSLVPLSMGLSRPEYWTGLPFPSPGDLPDPGMEPRSPTLQADPLSAELPGKPHSNLMCSEDFFTITFIK